MVSAISSSPPSWSRPPGVISLRRYYRRGVRPPGHSFSRSCRAQHGSGPAVGNGHAQPRHVRGDNGVGGGGPRDDAPMRPGAPLTGALSSLFGFPRRSPRRGGPAGPTPPTAMKAGSSGRTPSVRLAPCPRTAAKSGRTPRGVISPPVPRQCSRPAVAASRAHRTHPSKFFYVAPFDHET